MGRDGTLGWNLGWSKKYPHLLLIFNSLHQLSFNLQTSSVQIFPPIFEIYKSGNFVDYYWGCKTILSSYVFSLKIPGEQEEI